MSKRVRSTVRFSVIILPVVGALFVLGIFLFVARTWNHILTPSYYDRDVLTLPSDVHLLPAPLAAPVKVPVLLYHYVEFVKDKGDTIRQSLDIIPPIFENQIKTLLSDGYTFITFNEFADYLDGIAALPNKPVILTFDDGYGDFYTDVMPILFKYKVKAVAFIITGFLDKHNFMTTNQLKFVASSGLVEVAAHTVHHVNLRSVGEKVADMEIGDSKTELESIIGKRVHTFAYPYGDFNEMAIRLVKKAGYRTGVSVVEGSMHSEQDRYFVYRLRPGARTGKELTGWIENLTK
jgi:peptidoglycan/xylan/chitin deacetylase (PgdA/CDA1 family)